MPDFDPYHFAADYTLLGIPHFWNVITNVPFLFLGFIGLRAARPLHAKQVAPARAWSLLWVSTLLLCFGSGFYHWALTPISLLMDRVCIAGITAGLCWQALIAARLASARWVTGIGILAFFVAPVVAWYALGLSSVVYGLQQALIAVVVLVVHFRRDRGPSKLPRTWPLVAMVVCYAAAKALEVGDEAFARWAGHIGGHPLKHLLSAIGLAWLIVYMRDEAQASPTFLTDSAIPEPQN